MEIRTLRWSDFESWADLQSTRYDELETRPDLGLYTFASRPTLVDHAHAFASLRTGILEGRIVSNVADESGVLLGHATIYPKGDYREVRHVGSLGMTVRAGHRGRGIGRGLLVKTLVDCQGKYEIVELSVTATNAAALRLYRTVGFEERGRLPRSFKRGDLYLDEIIMSRRIEDQVSS